MAYCFLTKDCDMLLSTDNDFSALTGPRCICLKRFKVVGDRKKSKLKGKHKKETESCFVFEFFLAVEAIFT